MLTIVNLILVAVLPLVLADRINVSITVLGMQRPISQSPWVTS